MKNVKLIVFSLFILGSCVTTTSEFQVSRIGDEPSDYLERFIYVLPRTIMEVKITFEKESFIPGPYRNFSEKFLGMESNINEPGFTYRITDVSMKSSVEPDPEQYYSINLKEGTFDYDKYLDLGNSGYVLNPASLFMHEALRYGNDNLSSESWFTDLAVKRHLTETTDTLYKTMITDSSYVRIPVVRKQRDAKTLEQKAEEAANFIIKTRKRRFKLLAGQYDVFPEGQALAISVEELDKTEKEYLELFLGKKVKQEFTQSFIIIPEKSSDIQKITVAKFSQETGLRASEANTGRAVVMEIEALQTLKALPSTTQLLVNNLYYRIPDIANVRLKIDSEILYESRMSIFQAGKMVGIMIND